MIVRTHLAREYDRGEVEALLSGKTISDFGWDDDGLFWVQVSDPLSDAETKAVRHRLGTAGDTEEVLHQRAEAAMDTNRTFRDSTAPQLVAGAQVIIDDPAIVNTEVPGMLKDLARAIKALTNQVEDLTRQEITAIRILLGETDAVD